MELNQEEQQDLGMLTRLQAHAYVTCADQEKNQPSLDRLTENNLITPMTTFGSGARTYWVTDQGRDYIAENQE